MGKNRGFGLIELLAALGVLAIVLAVALPNFLGWRTDTQLRSAAEHFKGAVKLAKSRSVRDRKTVGVNMASDNYFVFVDAGNGSKDPAKSKYDQWDPIVYERQLPEGIRLEFDATATAGDSSPASGARASSTSQTGMAGNLFPVDFKKKRSVTIERKRTRGRGGPGSKGKGYYFVISNRMEEDLEVWRNLILFDKSGRCITPRKVILVNSKGEKFMVEITEWTITKVTKIG